MQSPPQSPNTAIITTTITTTTTTNTHQETSTLVTTTTLTQPPQQRPCPRCFLEDTKFCYYNNYSTSQPRHFCRSCRRHWTHGGALWNIPVGGGTRKNNKRKKKNSWTPPPLRVMLPHLLRRSTRSIRSTIAWCRLHLSMMAEMWWFRMKAMGLCRRCCRVFVLRMVFGHFVAISLVC